MTSWQDVKFGYVTLAEIVKINHYLDMVADIKYFSELDEMEKLKRRR